MLVRQLFDRHASSSDGSVTFEEVGFLFLQGYVERVSVSTTQGKGFPIAQQDLVATVRADAAGKAAA